MKKWILLLVIFFGCQENQPAFDEELPKIELDKIVVLKEGGGFGTPIIYSLSFSGNLINLTDNVFKSYRQQIQFTAANGNQINAGISLPMFRWLCPHDTLYSGGRSDNFEENYIDSVVSFVAIEDGLVVVYGDGDECDN